jgi:hypothetical protein
MTLTEGGRLCSRYGVRIDMWWLTFLHGGVAIIEASSLTHARALAAAHGLGRVSHFGEGHFIDPDCLEAGVHGATGAASC